VEGDTTVWRGDTLSRHWLVPTTQDLSAMRIALTKAHLGELDRRSFYCESCRSVA
jgi:hypothetical protein